MRKTLVAIAVTSTLTIMGCGTSCPEIASHREAFSRTLARTDRARGPDLRLTLPFSQLDPLLADAVERQRLEVDLSPPGPLAGLALEARLAGARARAMPAGAADGVFGLTLEVELTRRGTPVLLLDVDTTLRPTLVTRPEPGLVLTLPHDAVEKVRPRTTADGRAMLSRWLERELPPALRALGSREMMDAVADDLLGWVAAEGWPLIASALPNDRPLFETALTLPELTHLGVLEMAVKSEGRALTLDFVTSVDAPPLAPSRTDPKRTTLSMSGKTAMALVSRAMERGALPGRFSARGDPDPDGPWEARVGWLGGGRPLHLLLWRMRDRCERAEVGASVALRVEGDELAVDVREGRLLTLAGPPFAEAFAWLEGLFGKALAFSFRSQALVALGDSAWAMRLVDARLDEALTLELQVERRRPPDPR